MPKLTLFFNNQVIFLCKRLVLSESCTITHNMKLPVTFQTYVLYIVGNTEGHDRFYGHFTTRFAGVCQLCRICTKCPMKKSGYSKSKNFPYRLPSKVNRAVARDDTDALRAMSQQKLIKGFRNVLCFGSHNERGIFGACPGEILHLVLIGCITSFSTQPGLKSKSLQQYDWSSRPCSMMEPSHLEETEKMGH